MKGFGQKAFPVLIALSASVLLMVAASSGQDERKSRFTKHFKDSLFEVTEKGLFSVEMIIKGGGLKVGSNRAEIVIHDKNDRDAAGVEILILPVGQLRDESSAFRPVISDKGNGLYLIDNIFIGQEGRLALRVTVKRGAEEDSAVFDVPVIKR